MARSATADVIEGFRFEVLFLNFERFSLFPVGQTDDESRAGFSEVTLPRVNVKERTYRENISPTSVIKGAGLTSYEPVTMRRGKVNDNRSLYQLIDTVVNAASIVSPSTAVISDAGIIPVYNPDYRIDFLIKVRDRSAQVRKSFFVFNAFPTSYKPGDDLNANDDKKLIEEITFTYENFIELNTDDLGALREEQDRALLRQVSAGVAAGVLGL